LTVVFTTPGFAGDVAAAEQAIFAAAVPEPTTVVLAATAIALLSIASLRGRRQLSK
jgi:hypothetical protein